MNHQLWKAVGTRVLALVFVIAGAAACGDDVNERTTGNGNGNGSAETVASADSAGTPLDGARGEVSPSAQVIGVAPAPPTAEETPQAAQAPEAKAAPPQQDSASKVTQAEESTERPKEGDNHSYSTTAPVTEQKAEGVNPQELPSRKTQ
jgi:hypothetical protein